jgi:hypothetical protein
VTSSNKASNTTRSLLLLDDPNIKNTRLKPQSQLRFGQNGFTNQIKIHAMFVEGCRCGPTPEAMLFR